MPKPACPVCGAVFTPNNYPQRTCSLRCRTELQVSQGAERFWSKVDRRNEGCWLWCGRISTSGYGRVGYHRRGDSYAHRVAWLVTYGPIPPGLFVCHRCDNRICVRPDHLFLGTAADNNRDMYAKGRGPKAHRWRTHPETHPNRRLADEQIRCIYVLAHARALQTTIARGFGVSPSCVSMVKGRYSRGRTTQGIALCNGPDDVVRSFDVDPSR